MNHKVKQCGFVTVKINSFPPHLVCLRLQWASQQLLGPIPFLGGLTLHFAFESTAREWAKYTVFNLNTMAKQWHMVCLWIIWHFQTSNVTAFNLDTENVLQRNGDPGSLFGFSVAFHQQLKPARKNLWVKAKQFVSLELIKRLSYCLVFSTRLLVGAPRAKHQNQVNVTGVVYKCDLTTTSKSCQPIEFDDKGLCTLSEAIFIIVLW